MQILVAGGSGVIGTALVPRLVAHGHRVVATTRRPERLDALRALGAEPALLDALDSAAVAETVARVAPEAIAHEMTSLSGPSDMRRFDRWFAATNALRTQGTANLVAAARANGVRRLVAQSYTGWNNPRVGGPVTSEADGFDPDPAPQQKETLAAIVAMERLVLDAPLEGVVLRYANLYGPGAIDGIVAALRRRMLPIIGSGAGVWSWLHVDDAASATVAALESGVPGAYNVADDDPATVAQWLPALAEAAGAPAPMRIPTWIGRLLAGEAAVRWMTAGRGSSNAKAKEAFRWRPTWPTWREGFRVLCAADAGVGTSPADARA